MSEATPPPNSLVSVIIPCRNEKSSISKCLKSVLASDYPDLEIIVVDGMSEDGTFELLTEIQRTIPHLKVLRNRERTTPQGFNLGVTQAKGEFVQRVDARNIVAKDYISRLVQILKMHPEVMIVGGHTIHTSDNQAGAWISVAMEAKFGVGASNYRAQTTDGYVDTVGVPLYRRRIFDEVGLFDLDLIRNQDDEFSFRTLQKGYKIFYHHGAKVHYFVRDSFPKLFRQYYQYGYYKPLVNRKRGGYASARQLVPPLFVLGLLLGPLVGLLYGPLGTLWLSAIIIYFIGGFFAAGEYRSSIEARINIQLAMLIMHIGYGLGYLKGFCDFLILRKTQAPQSHQQQTH